MLRPACEQSSEHGNTNAHDARTRAMGHTRTHAHTHARTHARAHARTHARMHTHTHARTHASTHASTHTHTHTHVHTRTTQAHTRTNTRTHTSTHARALRLLRQVPPVVGEPLRLALVVPPEIYGVSAVQEVQVPVGVPAGRRACASSRGDGNRANTTTPTTTRTTISTTTAVGFAADAPRSNPRCGGNH